MHDNRDPFQSAEINPFTGEVQHRNNGGGAIILLLVLAPIIMASTVFLAVIFPVAGFGALIVG
jgi:membrane-associated phospholipid phosphatase